MRTLGVLSHDQAFSAVEGKAALQALNMLLPRPARLGDTLFLSRREARRLKYALALDLAGEFGCQYDTVADLVRTYNAVPA